MLFLYPSTGERFRAPTRVARLSLVLGRQIPEEIAPGLSVAGYGSRSPFGGDRCHILTAGRPAVDPEGDRRSRGRTRRRSPLASRPCGMCGVTPFGVVHQHSSRPRGERLIPMVFASALLLLTYLLPLRFPRLGEMLPICFWWDAACSICPPSLPRAARPKNIQPLAPKKHTDHTEESMYKRIYSETANCSRYRCCANVMVMF